MNKLQNPGELEKLKRTIQDGRDPKKPIITICGGTGCKASGCDDIIGIFKNEIEKQNLGNKVDIRITGCHGF